ncbi:TrmB family transcriptional regulator [Picrophilus oshimae]|uniref:Sugar-specific transcriptional regulator TrmB n=1 Tax=Picrophilus torridus (strain ATCC 700027 / DSM 9790 / JCM 10055 / NBRC 100828 / KAW 2/3) TaxID=1122961 RepID=A0A8G2FWT3_PICTO|nr:TrmB family transcriptional regulator [Picrophilus oshimae]SMD30896.1 Sugar-specific transcriptional regulator TrmB [Picrophilus oshimae DSM 9789]
MSDDDLFGGLAKFGLSNYEIKVYKTLLLKGPNTPTGTVKIAGIPQPRIYDLFSSLQEKGFVDTVTGKKHLYRAVPVSIVLRRQVAWMDNYVNSLEEYVEKYRETEDVKEPYIWFVKGNKNVEDRMKSMFYSARDEIILSLSKQSFLNMSGFISRTIKKGITIALVLFSDSSADVIEKVPKGTILKIRDQKPLEMMMVDRSYILSNLKSGVENSDYSIYLEEDQLMHVLSYYFLYNIWQPSEYRYYPDNGGFYYRFTTIWLACDVIDYYLRLGIKVKGQLSGIYKNNRINITGIIKRVERINGVKQSFFIESSNGNFSVGGKSAILEDVKMLDLEISRL